MSPGAGWAPRQERGDWGRGAFDPGDGVPQALAYRALSRGRADFFDRLNPEAMAQRLVNRLNQLGYDVEVHKPPVSLERVMHCVP